MHSTYAVDKNPSLQSTCVSQIPRTLGAAALQTTQTLFNLQLRLQLVSQVSIMRLLLTETVVKVDTVSIMHI